MFENYKYNELLEQIMVMSNIDWERLIEQRRFWKQVDMSGGKDACWPWLGCDNGNGYGVARLDKRTNHSHRVAWILSTGEVPNHITVVRHKCDNRICVNPNHLELGTHADNANDRIQRKGDQKGEHNYAAKFTEEQVFEMRKLAHDGIDGKKIAEKFGASEGIVSLIIRGHSWKHSYDPNLSPKKKYWNRNNSRQLFTPQQIHSMRDRYEHGERITDLTKEFNVSRGTIYRIVHYQIYREIP